MHIKIQRDGRISIDEGVEVYYADTSDPFAIMKCFRATVEFENGLTGFQLVKALMPWSKAISAAGWINLDAWFAKMAKPYLELAEEQDAALSSIEILPAIIVHRKAKGDAKSVSLYAKWQTSGRYSVPQPNGFGGNDEMGSVSFLDPRLLGQLPIKIVSKATVNDMMAEAPWGERPVVEEARDDVYDELHPLPTFFDVVVLGFLDDISFHGSPKQTEILSDELISMVSSIKAGELDADEFVLDAEVGRSILHDLDVPAADDLSTLFQLSGLIRTTIKASLEGVCTGQDIAEAIGVSPCEYERLAEGKIGGRDFALIRSYVTIIEGLTI